MRGGCDLQTDLVTGETPADAPALSRRERRRSDTREEILEAALGVITERGASDLNLSEVARRVGMRQPSLYQYFDSRLAIYDALFERGMHKHLDVVRAAVASAGAGVAAVRAIAVATVRFSVDHPALSQLLFMPAVPGFEPSEQAYRPSQDVLELVSGAIASAVHRGELSAAAATEQGSVLLRALTAGVASLQLGNDQHAGFTEGRFAPFIEPALDMFVAYFAP